MNLKVHPEDVDKTINVEVNSTPAGSTSNKSVLTNAVIVLVLMGVSFLGGMFYTGVKNRVDIVKQQIAIEQASETNRLRSERLDEIETLADRAKAEDGLITVKESRGNILDAVGQVAKNWEIKFNNKEGERVEIPVIPEGLITWDQCIAANVVRPPQAADDKESINALRRQMGLKEL